ncbi:MAG: phosphotransferase [Pseudomonadota bacterium]
MRAMRSPTQTDDRFASARRWLDDIGLQGTVEVASADASFRRYFRCRLEQDWATQSGSTLRTGDTLVLMDAPPPQEDVGAFVRVTRQLASTGIPVPEVYAENLEQGFLLLTDFGRRDLMHTLNRSPHSVDDWYRRAGDLLHQMQADPVGIATELPPYDEARLRQEMQLFVDWLCEVHLKINWDDHLQQSWIELTDALVRNALQQPQVVVHRDFHCRNLMVVNGESLGVIDHQDAMFGPLTYDLVSLLRDCYIEWPLERVTQWACEWMNASGVAQSVNETQRLRWFFLTGVQRQLKAAGIFARLAHRDGKMGYLGDVPRTLGYIIAIGDAYPELRWIAEFIESRCLTGLLND